MKLLGWWPHQYTKKASNNESPKALACVTSDPLGPVEKVEIRAISYAVYKSLDFEIARKYNNRTYMFLFYEL